VQFITSQLKQQANGLPLKSEWSNMDSAGCSLHCKVAVWRIGKCKMAYKWSLIMLAVKSKSI